MRSLLVSAITAVIGLGLVPGGPAQAQGLVIAPVRECAELRGDYAIPGAVTHVTAADPVAADPGTGAPAYCDVRGVVEPAVGFRLRLPLDTYAGRYVQYGCHGLCGVAVLPERFPEACGPRPGDAAIAATDDGHVGQGGFPFNIIDGTWAANDRAARDDYFFRAPHVVSLASKRIIAAFYGSPPRRSYFNGCSTGGREALLLAQRYPRDFDGIIAGSPANYMGPMFGVYFTWLGRTNNRPDGTPILTLEKLPVLHDAVLAACDGLDGLVDGQIDDPRACRFDPVEIQCAPGTDQPGCLTAEQVASARRLYEGPKDEHGRRLYPGWQSRGSELAWAGAIVPVNGFNLTPLADNYHRYVGYPIGTPHSTAADFRFTAEDFHRLTPEGAKGNALSLDLREFRRAGGKLILWHAWDDQSIPAVGTLDYYARLARHGGGLAETRRWARTFLVPTMYHCDTGGYRLTGFDPYPELVAWVEGGRAPEKVIATGTSPEGNPRTRPVFAYPLQARYDGSGSVDDAGNFVPVAPPAPPRDAIDWIGSYLHTIPGPVAR